MTIAKKGAAGSLAMLLAACLSACTSGGSQAEGSRGPEPVTSPATRLATSANPTSSRDPGAQTLSCDNAHVAASPPGPEYEVVLGVVALPTSPSHPAVGIGRPSDVPGPARFAKDGLAIKAGAAAFELEAVDVPGVRTAIAWGNYSASHRRVDVPSCPDTGGTGWLF